MRLLWFTATYVERIDGKNGWQGVATLGRWGG
jgi:hypothetical protein